jgi:hypothetical protein
MADDDKLLGRKFVPCVIHFDDGNYTELALVDGFVVWTVPKEQPLVDLGYDENGDLVAVRISGKHAKRINLKD